MNKSLSDTLEAFATSISHMESIFTERMHVEWRAPISDGLSFDSVFVMNCPSDLRLVIRTYDGVCGFVGKEFVFHQTESQYDPVEQF